MTAPGDGDQLGTDSVEADVVELLLGEPCAGETELQDGNAGGAEVDDLRRQDAGRQLAQHELGDGADLRVGGVQTGARLQVDLDDDYTGDGGGFGVLDVVDQRGESLLVGRGESAFELLGIETGVLPGDRDDRDIDVGEDVGRASGG